MSKIIKNQKKRCIYFNKKNCFSKLSTVFNVGFIIIFLQVLYFFMPSGSRLRRSLFVPDLADIHSPNFTSYSDYTIMRHGRTMNPFNREWSFLKRLRKSRHTLHKLKQQEGQNFINVRTMISMDCYYNIINGITFIVNS